MHSYNLDLFRTSPDDHPVSTVTVGPTDNQEIARFGHIYARISLASDLFKIKNGTNPRALNKESKKVKAIRKTLEDLRGFAVYNGGVCVVIDDDSFHWDRESDTISFSCKQEGSGHYDGQHTTEAIRQSAAVAVDQQVSVTFVENRFFRDRDGNFVVPDGIRYVAETWNSRETQKPHSEQNQRGLFDVLKDSLSEKHVKNIGWRENERNEKNDMIQKECRADRLVSLIYTAVPSLRSMHLDTGDDMYSILRRGYKSTSILEDESKRQDFEKLYPHADCILRIHDYIQKNLRSAFNHNATSGESFDELEIVRKSGKPDMRKPTQDRKFWKQQLFDGTTVEGALLPDYMQPVMYGILNNVMRSDRHGNIGFDRSPADLERLWDEVGLTHVSSENLRRTSILDMPSLDAGRTCGTVAKGSSKTLSCHLRRLLNEDTA